MSLPMAVMIGLLALATTCACGADDLPPWKTNAPLVTVSKTVYAKSTRPGAAAIVSVQYVGPGLERREVHGVETSSDVLDAIQAHWSSDNGRTWGDFVPVQPSNNVNYGGVIVWEGEGISTYDPASGMLVQAWLRQIANAGLYHDWTYMRYSKDQGRTWTEPVQLRYEDGAGFDPAKPLDPAFLDHNEAYIGNDILIRKDGTLVHGVANANAAGDPKNNERVWRMGTVLFLGKWDAQRGQYDWTAGAHTEISPDLSARGAMEPEVAELNDGRLLVVWRGSDTGWDGTVAKVPGHKWYAISSDGGKTLSPIAEWKYDDGTPFYSPSSFHRMLRHSVTGKLYWFGNICATPPSGNSPRYPLIMAEVDEATGCLKRSTVTAIDDRQPGQGDVQFSNLSVLENRETHEIEMYLTTYGQEPAGDNWATADCWKYVLTLAR